MLDACDQLRETLASSSSSDTTLSLYRAHEAYVRWWCRALGPNDPMSVLRHLAAYCSHTVRSSLVALSAHAEEAEAEWLRRGHAVLGRLDALNSDEQQQQQQQQSIVMSNEFVVQMLGTAQLLVQWLDDDDDDDGKRRIRRRRNQQQQLAVLDHAATVFLNNAALVHHVVHKFSVSSLYLRKALEHNAKSTAAACAAVADDEQQQQQQQHKGDTSDDDTKQQQTKDDDEEIEEEEESNNNNNNNHGEKNFVDYATRLMMNKRHELAYNMGISLLFGKQPVAAFECLYKVAHVYNENARLWLRIAECCIMCYRNNNNSSLTPAAESSSTPSGGGGGKKYIPSIMSTSGNEKIAKLSEKIKCIQRSVAHAHHHKLVVGTGLNSTTSTPATRASLTMSQLATASDNNNNNKMITLDFAYVCLRNALALLPSNEQIFMSEKESSGAESFPFSKSNADGREKSSEAKGDEQQVEHATERRQSTNSIELSAGGVETLGNKTFNCVWPSKPIGVGELQQLRSSVLVALAYVTLCLNDYVSTIRYCRTLLDTHDPLNAQYPISRGDK